MIVEVSLNHPESVNRTNFDCVENGLPSVCMDLTLCFSYKGKEVPGYIGKGALTELTLIGVPHSFFSLCSFWALTVFHLRGRYTPLPHLSGSPAILTSECGTVRGHRYLELTT